MVLHFTMLYQFKGTAKDLEIGGLRVPVELLVIKTRSYTLVQNIVISVSVCHQNMSSAWGYVTPVSAEVLAMSGCRKSWWGLVSALFFCMYLSACGLQNTSPEGPLGHIPSDTVITGQYTNIMVYKTQNPIISFFPSSLANKTVFEHIFIQNEMIQIHTAGKSIISDITSENRFAFFFLLLLSSSACSCFLVSFTKSQKQPS